MYFKEAVSQRIFELCKENNITPNKLAEMSTIPPSTLLALLANKVDNPSSTVIYKVCKVFKINLKDFYNSQLFEFKNLED